MRRIGPKSTRIEPRMPMPDELAWVAGLLEGEGSFMRKAEGTARNVLVSCHMTDRDVLEKMHGYVGGILAGPYSNKPRGKLPRWSWKSQGPAGYALMRILLPLMCSRRSAKISGLLSNFDKVLARSVHTNVTLSSQSTSGVSDPRSAEIGWIAGLLEGEGCFRKKVKGGTDKNISVLCHMTDRDVLERLRKYTGGNLSGPYSNGPGRLPRHVWSLYGESAVELMRKILPWMGTRRSGKINSLIDAYKAVPGKTYQILNIKTGDVVDVGSMPRWCADNGVSESGMYRTMNGSRIQCRGWRRLS